MYLIIISIDQNTQENETDTGMDFKAEAHSHIYQTEMWYQVELPMGLFLIQ